MPHASRGSTIPTLESAPATLRIRRLRRARGASDRPPLLREAPALAAAPGMTGHWQVLGSSHIPLHEMLSIDYLYVANWSLWTDLKLLVRTVGHVLARGGR